LADDQCTINLMVKSLTVYILLGGAIDLEGLYTSNRYILHVRTEDVEDVCDIGKVIQHKGQWNIMKNMKGFKTSMKNCRRI